MKSILLLLLLSLTLPTAMAQPAAADWPIIYGDAEHTGYSEYAGALINVTEKWSFPVGDGVGSSPLVLDIDRDGHKEVVFGSDDGYVYAVNYTGGLLWKYKTGDKVTSPAAVGDINNDGVLEICIGSTDKNVYCLRDDGELFWKLKVYGFSRGAPVIGEIDNDGNTEVVVATEHNLIYAIDGESGIEEWRSEFDGGFTASPLIHDTDGDGTMEIIAACQDGKLYVLNGFGETLWFYDVQSPIFSTPSIVDKYILFGTVDGRLIMLDMLQKNIVWEAPLGDDVTATPAIADINRDGIKEIIVGSSTKESYTKNWLYAINLKKVGVWNYSTEKWPVYASAVIADINRDSWLEVVFTANDGDVVALDYLGRKIWEFGKYTGSVASPALADIDEDGDIEIILGSYFSNRVYVLDSAPTPDLFVSDISFSTNEPKQNETINVTVAIANDGDLAANTVVAAFENYVGGGAIFNTTISVPQSGKNSFSFEWNYTLDTKVAVLVDPNNAIAESDETNNKREVGLRPDLTINITGLPDNATNGTQANGKIEVKNLGTVEAKNVSFAVFVNNDKKTVENVVVIGPNNTYFSNLSLTIQNGTEIIARVDPDNTIDEYDEGNNDFVHNISFLAPIVPIAGVASKTSGGGPQQTNLIVSLVLIAVVALIIVKKARGRRNKDLGYTQYYQQQQETQPSAEPEGEKSEMDEGF